MQAQTGGSVYLRLSTRVQEQPKQRSDKGFKANVIDGAYWWREPGPNCDLIIAYQGAVANEAIKAAGVIGTDRRDIGVLAVTSADRLHENWRSTQKIRANGDNKISAHIERLMGSLPPHCRIITVIDGHPTTLSLIHI